ncbi:MAG: gliding motility-associated C-terminal domain-containing protein [Phaeodactylibacter sp.]|nr:gliding motility-associated C-terminal domain-containing protein [Phaeodactylibacter sp.]
MLSAQGTTTGANVDYNWTTPDGIILNGAQSLNPEVNASGTYTLQVANNQNGCSSNATVFVPVDTLSPIAAAGTDNILNCNQPILQLGSSNTSTGNRFTYAWSGSTPLSGDTTVAIFEAETAGTYQLLVTDTINGCQATDMVVLAEDFLAPVAVIAMPDTLNCVDSLVVLDGAASSTIGNFSYTWTALVSGVTFITDMPVAEVTATGNYTLAVENLDNGCTATDTVEVFQDVNLPFVGIEQADTLTCTQTQITLQAAISSSNINFDIQWGTNGGNFLSGQTTLQPIVDAPGVYELVVTDLANDCSVNANIAVVIDTLSPTISLSPAGVLNCQDTLLTLNGTTPSASATWSWSTPDGNLISGAGTSSPMVDQPGVYEATVVTPVNGCTNTLSQTVLQDITIPAVNIEPSDVLTCTQTSVTLNGSDSDQNAGWSITWQAPDGNNFTDDLTTEAEVPGVYILEIINTDNFCRNSASVTVSQDTLQPVVSLSPADILDCGTPTVALSSTVNNIAGPSYQWSTTDGLPLPGGNTLNTNTTMPGWYFFTAINENNGCQTIDSLFVQQDTITPTLANLSISPLTCTTTQAWLNAATGNNPAWIYSWTANQGGVLTSASDSSAVQVIAAGAYEVSVTDPGNACSATQSYTVTIDTLAPMVSIALPDTLNCGVTSVPLIGNGSDSGTGFGLSWSTIDGQLEGQTDQPDAIATAPGTYTLTILNLGNGCTADQSTVVALDTLSPAVQIAAADTLNCNVSSILIDATGSSVGNTITYSWSTNSGLILNGGDGPQPEAGAAGQYTLVVTNSQNLCSTTGSVMVPIDTLSPNVSLAIPDVLNCDQNSVPLSGQVSNAGNGYDLVWNGPAGGILSGQDGLDPIVALPGTYGLTITNPNNGCFSVVSVMVIEDITPPTASAGIDFIIPCFPELRQLDGSNSSTGSTFSYSWSSINGTLLDGLNSLNPDIDGPGTYTLLVTNVENGCTATDEVDVTQDIPEATATTIQPLCFGDMGQINFENITGGAPPYLYSIDGGEAFQNSPSFQVMASGTYNLIVQDVNGCEAALTTSITQPDSLILLLVPETVEINFGESHPIQLQSNYPLNELKDIVWSPNPGLDCYDCLTPNASPGISTVYQVSATNNNGCRDIANIRIAVNKNLPVFIPSGFSPNGDGNNNWFTVYAEVGVIVNIRSMQVFSRWGEKVFENQNFQPNTPQEGWDGFFRNQTLNSGVFAYVVEVELIDGSTEILRGDVTLTR